MGSLQPPIRRKKKHTGLKVFIILLVIFVVFPIAFVFIFLFDANHFPITPRSYITSPNDVFNEIVVNSFERTTEDEHTFDIRVNQTELNEVIYFNHPEAIRVPGVDIGLNNAYILIHSDCYEFVIEANALFFKTRVHLYATLENDETNSQFIFDITDFKIGSLPILGIAKWGVNSFVDKNFIINAIHDAGFSMELDFENFALRYKYEDIINDLVNMTGSSEYAMYAGFINEAFDNNLMDLLPYDYESIDMKIQLNQLHANYEYTTPSQILDLRLKEYQSKIEAMINAGIFGSDINDIKNQGGKVFTYLIRGYSNCSSDIQSLVDSLPSFAQYGISNKHTYVPYVDLTCQESEQIQNVVKSRLEAEINAHPEYMADPTKSYVTNLYETDIHKAIKGAFGIGTITLFLARNSDTTYKTSFLTFDNIYINILSASGSNPAKMYLNLDLSLDGYPIEFILETKFYNSSYYSISLSFEDTHMYLGNIEISNELRNQIYNILASALTSETLNFDLTHHQISVDLSNCLSASTKAVIASSGKQLHITPKGSNITANGYFEIKISN